MKEQKIMKQALSLCLSLLLLLALAACGGGTNQADSAPAEGETELDQLKSENEDLRTELAEAAATQEETEARLKELEDAITAMQETQDTTAEPAAAPVEVAPPELSPSQLLLGEWFAQEFHEEGVWSWTQSIVFNAGGTGTICRTHYIPKSELETVDDPDDLMLFDADMLSQLTWSLDGDTLHVDIDNDSNESADFTYSPEQQELYVGNAVYVRERPFGMEGYVERSLYARDFEAEKALLRRRFLGNWYFDVMVWTFNDDGTGTADIPEIGNQPAETREFSYSVSESDVDGSMSLIFDWVDSDWGTWYCYPTFNDDGSMNLNPLGGSKMKLTRTFDETNCPITMEIISRGIGVFSGSIFNDILGGD